MLILDKGGNKLSHAWNYELLLSFKYHFKFQPSYQLLRQKLYQDYYLMIAWSYFWLPLGLFCATYSYVLSRHVGTQSRLAKNTTISNYRVLEHPDSSSDKLCIFIF